MKFGKLLPSSIEVMMFDKTRLPVGFMFNVPVQIDKTIVPTDFPVMDIDISNNWSIVLVRNFLTLQMQY
jgi:hypothetical protein